MNHTLAVPPCLALASLVEMRMKRRVFLWKKKTGKEKQRRRRFKLNGGQWERARTCFHKYLDHGIKSFGCSIKKLDQLLKKKDETIYGFSFINNIYFLHMPPKLGKCHLVKSKNHPILYHDR